MSGPCDSVSSAVQVSTYKSKIDETTRKMMALVSELSMQQVSMYIHTVLDLYTLSSVGDLCHGIDCTDLVRLA